MTKPNSPSVWRRRIQRADETMKRHAIVLLHRTQHYPDPRPEPRSVSRPMELQSIPWKGYGGSEPPTPPTPPEMQPSKTEECRYSGNQKTSPDSPPTNTLPEERQTSESPRLGVVPRRRVNFYRLSASRLRTDRSICQTTKACHHPQRNLQLIEEPKPKCPRRWITEIIQNKPNSPSQGYQQFLPRKTLSWQIFYETATFWHFAKL